MKRKRGCFVDVQFGELCVLDPKNTDFEKSDCEIAQTIETEKQCPYWLKMIEAKCPCCDQIFNVAIEKVK